MYEFRVSLPVICVPSTFVFAQSLLLLRLILKLPFASIAVLSARAIISHIVITVIKANIGPRGMLMARQTVSDAASLSNPIFKTCSLYSRSLFPGIDMQIDSQAPLIRLCRSCSYASHASSNLGKLDKRASPVEKAQGDHVIISLFFFQITVSLLITPWLLFYNP